jgi:hypothetical protein
MSPGELVRVEFAYANQNEIKKAERKRKRRKERKT